MLLDLPLVKTYLKIEQDYLEEDTLLELMIKNAEAYISNTVGQLDTTNDKQLNQAKLLALVLVTDFYENRELTGKPSNKVRFIVESIITQFQYSYGGGI